METTRSQPARESTGAAAAARREAILSRGRAVLQAEANALRDAQQHLGAGFVQAVELLLECRGRVCVTGVGKAGLIGAKIQATLASTGTLAYPLHPVEALHGDLGMIHADDVVLALSKSGSSELVELLPRLKELGCRVILLTARPDSAAAQHADAILHIGDTAEACPLGLAPSSSTTAMLALGDALALTVMELKDVRPEQYARYHPGGALGRYLMKTGQIMRTDSDCPQVRVNANLQQCFEAILAAPRRAGAAAVVDDADKLVGIITHGDFFRIFTRGDFDPAQRVDEVMTLDPKRVTTTDRVTEAITLMRRHAIDELPVVDQNGKLAGMIDVQDLIARGYSELNSH